MMNTSNSIRARFDKANLGESNLDSLLKGLADNIKLSMIMVDEYE